MTPTAGSAQAPPSQTLSRGIRALEILADAQQPLTIAELADAMGVHRSVAYRILRTLEDHSLLVRDDGGRVQPGPGLAVLARGVSRNLQTAALPELTQLANALTMSAFVAVWDHEECVTLVTVDPRHTGAAVVQHPGLPAPDQRRRARHRDPVRAFGAGMAPPRPRHPLPRRSSRGAPPRLTPPAMTRSSPASPRWPSRSGFRAGVRRPSRSSTSAPPRTRRRSPPPWPRAPRASRASWADSRGTPPPAGAPLGNA